MNAVWARLGAELRTGLRGLLAMAFLLGLGGAVTLASAAAGWRTDTAYARFVSAERPPDAFVLSGPRHGSPIPHVDLRRVIRLPQVLEGEIGPSFFGLARTTDAHVLWNGEVNIQQASAGVGAFGAKLLQGRFPNPGRPDEIAVGYRANQDPRVYLGARIQLLLFREGADISEALAGNARPADFLRPVTVRVVGVVLVEGELQGSADVFTTPAFLRVHGGRAFTLGAAAVRLRRGVADFEAFSGAVDDLAPGAFVFSIEDEAAYVARSTHLVAISMWLFAALAAVAALLIFGQALVRRTYEESIENPRLRALGMTARQLFAVAMVRAALVGVAGAVIAVVISYLLSPLSPLGRLARVAEPHPDFSFDSAVLLGGAAAIVMVAVAVGIVPALRASRIRGDAQGSAEISGIARPSSVVGSLARAGFPPSAVAGVRLALEPGRGRTATPVRSAIVGAALSVAALATAATFSSSFGHLLDTPRLYGRNWDIDTGNPFAGSDLGRKIIPFLRSDPAVSAIAAADIRDSVRVGRGDGIRANVWAIRWIRGRISPTVLEGRFPTTPAQIALGTKTLRAIHASVGDDVPVFHGTKRVTMRVVGRVVLPDVGFGPGLGEGGGLTLSGLRQFVPGAVANGFALNVVPGTDIQAEIRKLDQQFARFGAEASGPSEGTELNNLRRIQALPLLLAGVLGLAAAAAVAHLLVTSVRRRRRDLAILKTLGFVRRQVSATVAWQATTVVVIALAVGLPLGIAAGRWTWTFFADQLGVVPEPVIALVSVLLAIPAVIVAGNLMAAVPGRLAARTRPAEILRSE
jgi:ABC-type lipoprotein release transport system permease subunit